MRRAGTADLPLHPGHAPPWLFKRMVSLSRGILTIMVEELGLDTTIDRITDPFWFQSLACVLGFDWHSSGTTTVTTGALATALSDGSLGLYVAGGKGVRSRETPVGIERYGTLAGLSSFDIESLKRSSRMAARVDNSALQDGYDLYHHAFFFTETGRWAVVQQGMNPEKRMARRYHWSDASVKERGFVVEPHMAILGEREKTVMDTTSGESEEARRVMVDVVRENPAHLRRLVAEVKKLGGGQTTLSMWTGEKHLSLAWNINWDAIKRAYDFQPQNYEELIEIRGMGPKTVRALALISDLIFGSPPSWKDPVKYSFTVGGKDGVPYPVERRTMDETIEIIRQGIEEAKTGNREKLDAIRRLRRILPDYSPKNP